MNSEKRKPEIKYPTRWEYKIIGSDVDEMLAAVEECIQGLNYQVASSNVSSNENYFSLNVNLIVPSEIVRDIIFQKLSNHPAIKIVI
jgi:putative lipoic acid-binding regulatory protein